MKKILQDLIPDAIQVIKDTGIASGSDQMKVNSLFKGYISSYGASIVQSGLLSSTIFFENDEGTEQGVGSRRKICQAILLMLDRESNPGKIFNANKLMHKYLLANKKYQDPQLLAKIMDKIVVLKIALRTFNIQDDE